LSLLVQHLLAVRSRSVHSFVYFIDVFCHFFGHDAGANILVLRKENDYFITTNLNSHISADGVLNDDANEGAHHQMEVKS